MNPKPIEPIDITFAQSHPKAWGEELWIKNFEKYCLKLLKFKAGKDFSFHQHMIKEETWYVLEGELTMDYFDLEKAEPLKFRLIPGDVVHIPAGNPHKLTATKDSIIIEASTQHFEFDSYRIGKGASQNK